ncbi:MAG: hypothetical protein ACOYXT_23965 [Bacteroidota bacterium]
MAAENEPYRYNYQALDKLLAENYDPKELGNQLDEIMSDLVYLARDEDDFGRSLTYHHYTLRQLRVPPEVILFPNSHERRQ